MSTQTTNYHLVKPALTDQRDIGVINSNMDIIDSTMKSIDNNANGRKPTQSAVSDPSASGTSVTFIATISQNANGVISPSKKTVATVAKGAAGLCPALPNESTTTKYLRQDGTWQVPPDTNTDTKNTAGATDTSSKLFLIGATSQAANPQTYSQDTAYVGTDGCLYSGGSKVLTSASDTKNTAGATNNTSLLYLIGATSQAANPQTYSRSGCYVGTDGYLYSGGSKVLTSATDTKNTAGSTDTSSKIFLIGATSQATNPQTYSHDTCYVGTDGCLYSGGVKVLTAHQSLSGYVQTSKIANNLTTTSSGYVLDARQGKELRDMVAASSSNTYTGRGMSVNARRVGRIVNLTFIGSSMSSTTNGTVITTLGSSYKPLQDQFVLLYDTGNNVYPVYIDQSNGKIVASKNIPSGANPIGSISYMSAT